MFQIFKRYTDDSDKLLSLREIDFQKDEAHLFATQCYNAIADTMATHGRTYIIRDYAYIPCGINTRMVKRALRKLVNKNRVMNGFVNVWVTETEKNVSVLHWCIDIPMCVI